jgi:hypothetical protein
MTNALRFWILRAERERSSSKIIEQIMKNAGASSAKRELLIRDHVLKNIFAFEYLIAPYTIAHLKLSQYLEDRQIKLDAERHRFNIFLTNTLDRQV